jgi:hypothetical protein
METAICRRGYSCRGLIGSEPIQKWNAIHKINGSEINHFQVVNSFAPKPLVYGVENAGFIMTHYDY